MSIRTGDLSLNGYWRPMVCAILLSFLSMAGRVTAEIKESLTYDYYPVRVSASETLSAALHRATPIREEGRRYHGYAHWSVDWSFWWRGSAQSCHIDRVEVRLQGRIQLPKLEGGDADQRRQFTRYLAALEKHEVGHIGFGQRAAREIEWGIHRLAEAPSCNELEASANQIGHRIMRYYQDLEDRYDRDTEHGRTQGVVLDDK